MCNRHVFGLEAARQARACAGIRRQHRVQRLLRAQAFDLFRDLSDFHQFTFFGSPAAGFSKQGFAQTLALSESIRSSAPSSLFARAVASKNRSAFRCNLRSHLNSQRVAGINHDQPSSQCDLQHIAIACGATTPPSTCTTANPRSNSARSSFAPTSGTISRQRRSPDNGRAARAARSARRPRLRGPTRSLRFPHPAIRSSCRRVASSIIPAPKVALVSGSIKIKLPVVRLREYESKNSGTFASNSTSAISFICKRSAGSCASVFTFTRWRIRVARIFVCRAVCFTK